MGKGIRSKASNAGLGSIVTEAGQQPTHVRELVVGDAAYKGTLDASGEGAGGVWLPGTKPLAPIVWRWKWPQEVKNVLGASNNTRTAPGFSPVPTSYKTNHNTRIPVTKPNRVSWADQVRGNSNRPPVLHDTSGKGYLDTIGGYASKLISLS